MARRSLRLPTPPPGAVILPRLRSEARRQKYAAAKVAEETGSDYEPDAPKHESKVRHVSSTLDYTTYPIPTKYWPTIAAALFLTNHGRNGYLLMPSRRAYVVLLKSNV